MKYFPFAVALMILLVAIPLQAQTVTAAQKAEIEKAVKEQVVLMWRTADTLDVEKYSQFYSREKFMGVLAAGHIAATLEEMKQVWKKNWDNRKEQKRDPGDVRIHVLSADTAVAYWSSTLMIVLKSGDITNYRWAGTAIFTKESSGWKVTSLATASAVMQ